MAPRGSSPISILGGGLPASHSQAVGRLANTTNPALGLQNGQIDHTGRMLACNGSRKA